MKLVHLSYPVKNQISNKKIVLALGFFDGVHLGHQHLISVAKEIADEKNLPLAVMTFDRHPSEVYAGNTDFVYIDTLEEKANKMEELGVDYLLLLKFTKDFSKISGQEFVDNVIVKLGTDTVVAGFDYTYGARETANIDHLPNFAKGRFEVIKVPKQTMDGKKIGSTEIRRAIENGEMELVNELLGHHYVMSGTIGHGQRNGHKLGFPTANLVWNEKKAIPKIGVYATKTKVNGKWYNSMTSVGYNITIGQPKRIYIESNLFDFDEDVYGQPMEIKWYKYTRGEKKFASLDELKEQLKKDQDEIKAYFAKSDK
ncbi:riboflavin biosynthesis protein RibF [Lactobacillus kalixensis]|uniref:Riboflavin biosynthesis protein n=1 Tax=Lactobacillus kalixensis DSM 16043 TaxID=1423763 RepID=A0A0R1UD74_9LACO|nr:riboflavin biosynthesis protein RibF [Lactobacillus kalixensis]KRL90772.1 riboflavin biosynthesis protein RibF [Lactobacillus kalixensis DSM 16043]